MIVEAPWTDQQVIRLNRWQRNERVHGFTCPNEHEGDRLLIAGNEGWHCPKCAFTQNWAHDFMMQSPSG